MREFIEKMHDFNRQHYTHGNNYTLLMLEENGELKLYERVKAPCYGDLRVYSKNERKPGDLHNPFPNGTPIAVGVSFHRPSASYHHFVLTDERSPWHEVLHEVELTYNDKNVATGVVITDTNVDPTALVNLFMFCRQSPGSSPAFDSLVKDGVDPRIALMLSQVYYVTHAPYLHYRNSYVLSNVDPYNFFNGIFRKEPNTFRERYPYRRQGLETLFDGPRAKLVPHLSNKDEAIKILTDLVKE